MCHEQWWAQRRARRAKESQDIWLDFERTMPADDAPRPDEEPEVTRLRTEDEPLTADR